MTAEAMTPIVKDALGLARTWQDRANDLLTEEEKAIQAQMQRLMDHPMDKVVLTRMIDESFRPSDPARVADQVHAILTDHGIPDFFPKVERLLIQMFLGPGRLFPALTVPKMIEKMRESSSRAIISGDADALHAYLEKRKQEGVRVNINHLGEALLGETEARRRLETYIADLKDPAIEYISVKISTVYSQIHPLAFDHTVAILVERLSELYRVAAENRFVRADGTRVPKFVNLDMEEYRDLGITRAAFTQTLDQPQFKDYSAGIVLQAYLPDSFAIQRELTEWARQRVADGGSPIRLRIVKGANMEMEQVEAALFNWPLATYATKVETDANYKRMVTYGMRPENISAVRLGVASHNLFELAFARKLAEARQVTEHFHFEMLEGMADHVRRALTEADGDVLVYAPVARKEEFINAIAYLIRRLDENTSPENFLRHASHLRTDSRAWRFLRARFEASVDRMDQITDAPHRIQDRTTETFPADIGTFHHNQFYNEPDTDWSCPGNRRWAEEIRRQWENRAPMDIPLVVAGEEIFEDRQIREYVDLSKIDAQSGASVQVGRVALAGAEDARLAVATAKTDPDRWREKTARQRHEILSRAAMEIRRARGRLIGAAAANTGKVFTEADVEVSEAVDFAEYYPFAVRSFGDRPHLRCRGKGVVLVITPWNFPIAIPCGGMLAALAAGNTVIFKPASAAAMVGWELCQCLWRAGVSRHTLQFLPCSGDETGAILTMAPEVDAIILTGGTETGLRILQTRPGAMLAAETGGKNATIVTAMADRDQAIKNVIQSAFGNAGQKCSATSLLILEKEVYGDDHFKAQLVDAANSFKTGSAWRFRNRMGPLVHRPDKDLLRALTTLEPGETWALKPRMIDDNPHLWTPGIKYDVTPGGFTHMTEFFGPLLAVMEAKDLDHAIALVNQTGYGLTSGLESLDRREQARWKEAVRAGNLYINRGTTGAVVLRQPFGGMGKSALGAGIKVGGPNYVTQFMDIEEIAEPPVGPIQRGSGLLRLAQKWRLELAWGRHRPYHHDLHRTVVAIQSYLYHHEQTFCRETDYFHLRGQDNLLRYLPVGRVVIRLHENDGLFDVLGRIAAARVAGCTPVVSLAEGLHNDVIDFLKGPEGKRIVGEAAMVRQTDVQLVRSLPEIQRLRYAAADRVPAAVLEAAAKTGFYVSRSPVRMDGRLELLHYFREQSICDSYHRYGNLGERGGVAKVGSD